MYSHLLNHVTRGMFRNQSAMVKKVGLVLSVLYLSLHTNLNVKADSPTILEQKFAQYLTECWEEYDLTPKDLEDLKNSKMPDSEEVKCYFACAYKKSEMMNEKGLFWDDGVRKTSLEHYGNNETVVKTINEFIDICNKVNDVPVTDGEKGCERAALMFKCSVEHAPKFGFA